MKKFPPFIGRMKLQGEPFWQKRYLSFLRKNIPFGVQGCNFCYTTPSFEAAEIKKRRRKAPTKQKKQPDWVAFLELVIRIELMTSSLPMTCSTD